MKASSVRQYRVVITGRIQNTTAQHAGRDARLFGSRWAPNVSGGNGFYWRIAYHPPCPVSSSFAAPRMEFAIGLPDPASTITASGEYGGLWRRLAAHLKRSSRRAWQFRVSTFASFPPQRKPVATREPPSSLTGVDEDIIGDFGVVGGGAPGWSRSLLPSLGSPAHALVLASSENLTASIFRLRKSSTSAAQPRRSTKPKPGATWCSSRRQPAARFFSVGSSPGLVACPCALRQTMCPGSLATCCGASAIPGPLS